MKYILALSLLLTATVTMVQAQELTLKVTPPEADLIWRGLRELPVKDVEGLMGKIQRQVAEQSKLQPEPKKAK